MIEHVQANIMNSHVKIKNMILIEIRIYCFILFLMTVANFFSTIVILKQLNNASSIDNKTLFATNFSWKQQIFKQFAHNCVIVHLKHSCADAFEGKLDYYNWITKLNLSLHLILILTIFRTQLIFWSKLPI